MNDEPRMPAGFRGMPHNVEAEQALLGSILTNNEAYRLVRGFLRPDHFYEPVHGRIYAAMQRLVGSGRVADHITLKVEFNQDETLRGLNGSEYLARLARAAETILNADDYGRLVQDLAAKRGVIRIAEELTNKAYDGAVPDTAGSLIAEAHQSLTQLGGEAPGTIQPLDLDLVASEDDSPERWMIEDWMPVGTAGILTGPGSSGKSFLALIEMICLAAGIPFLGYAVEPSAAVGYFSEDNEDRLRIRVKRICRALEIDPRSLKGRLEVYTTVGQRCVLFEADKASSTVTTTEWLAQVHDRARRINARLIALDHVGRLTSINRIDPNQVFDLFGHLDSVSSSIDGCVCLLAHPSKGDIRHGSGPKVGGAIAMIDAPRWVHLLDGCKDEDGERFRVLTNHKTNYGRRFAIKLKENGRGIVESAGEVDPDNPAGISNSSRPGRKSKADLTLATLTNLYTTHRRAIALDELVHECMRVDIVAKAAPDSPQWRDRRRTIRTHLERHHRLIDDRGDSFAVKPEGLSK